MMFLLAIVIKMKFWVRDWLIPRLELSGVEYCVDYRDFEPGAPSVIEMERAIQSSQHTLLVLSQKYLESDWTEFESVMAQTLDPAARERRIIPLLIEEHINLPLRIKTLTYINFSESSILEEQLKRLVHAIGKQYGDRNKPRVLVVEDDNSWINITREVLGEFEVESVRRAEIGISKRKIRGAL